jgi:hypothetical protein
METLRQLDELSLFCDHDLTRNIRSPIPHLPNEDPNKPKSKREYHHNAIAHKFPETISFITVNDVDDHISPPLKKNKGRRQPLISDLAIEVATFYYIGCFFCEFLMDLRSHHMYHDFA